MIGVAVLGSTGSIGESTLDVLRRHPGQFRPVALSAQRNADRLFAQCLEFRPECAWIGDATQHAALAARLRTAGLPTRLGTGDDALECLATMPEAGYVMAAIVGAAGLRSTLAAAGAGKRVMIAAALAIKSVMEKAASPAVEISVPLVVEARAADNWDAAH